jgi:hypothetical protein
MSQDQIEAPRHRPGPPGKVILFRIVPLNPACMAGLAGHVPVKRSHGSLETILIDSYSINLFPEKDVQNPGIELRSATPLHFR